MHARREPPAAVSPAHIEPGTARYFASLYADAVRREVLGTLFEIEQEIATSLRPGLEHAVAHLRLGWWREEADRFARGTPSHRCTRRLLELAGGTAHPIEINGLVECTAWDLAAAPCETQAELDHQCELWARAMIIPFASCGPGALRTDGEVASAALRTGAALREIELLLQLAPDARRGRLRVPLDELDRMAIEPRTLAHPPWPAMLSEHLRRRFAILRATCEASFTELAPAARSHLTGLAAWCAVAASDARRATRALPAESPTRPLQRIADNVRAWRAARGALRA
jgi:phytoene/squalene synthetase